MLNKPLADEQADMRSRWADPAYRWSNDSALRRRYTKETNAKQKREVPNREPKIQGSVQSGSGEAGQVVQAEVEREGE